MLDQDKADSYSCIFNTIIQHYSALFSTIQHYSALFSTIQHYSALFNNKSFQLHDKTQVSSGFPSLLTPYIK